ncbi:MAG TPA: hypothetical protein VMH47_05240 [Gaiellaceae bacterium]|nr:hypothetical protein [Gaiellaceae bacterium]
MRIALAAACSLALLAFASPAGAATGAEQQLAAKYAPVVMLVQQQQECGPGEPYRPVDVDVLFGQDTVALRGPWSGSNLVKVAPTAADLARGLPGYHLDFPGNPLDPGCSYEEWEREIAQGTKPTVYAHVAAEDGKLALQYWFFYVFNDFNNTHEGDWEMIQLDFDAASAEQALERSPTQVGYSQHEGAERAAWDDSKLQKVYGTHPVVYVASGSHAIFFGSALYLGRSASEGVGCDDTRGPHDEVRPAVRTIPSGAAAAVKAFPWIAFEGRWGELQPAFFNGPTGPNMKDQWTEPISWSEGWRARSYAIPAGGALGTTATDAFCGTIATGSNLLRRGVYRTELFFVLVVLLCVLVVLLASRTSWRPSAPLRLARRRAWGQVVTASWRMYLGRLRLFLGIGLLAVPISILVAVVQTVVLDTASFFGLSRGGEGGGDRAWLVFAIGTLLSLAGMMLVQAAAGRAMVEIDAGRPAGIARAYRLAFARARPLVAALAIAVPVLTLLAASVVLAPLALAIGAIWGLVVPCVELESLRGAVALRRSTALARHAWFKVLTLVVGGAALVLVTGPLVGILLLLGTGASFSLVNVVAGVVYAIFMPLVGIATTYVYYDAVGREQLTPAPAGAVLPEEFAVR